MIIAFILAFLIGVFSVLLLEAFLLYKWWTSKEEDVRKPYRKHTRVTNPEFIADYFKKDSATEKESCMSLNLLLAFLWREWRDSPQMRAFFLKKMNFEFSELMQGRTASKLIEQITIEEFSLGSSLPVIKGATVMKIGAKDPKEVPQELDIAVDLEYSGGCHMAIQVDMLFNKSVYLAIKLVSLRGRARLQLSRHPLTHWSLAFYEEPEVEFEAESQFEGKNLPQLTTLIINHLRKSIQKKHTLPSYKIRYQPFFRELLPQDETQEAYVHDSLVTIGTLRVSVMGCSRLPEIENSVSHYCSLSVDLLPWSQLAENRRAMWPTFDIEINRENSDISFGLTLSKDISEDDLGKTIVIDTIVVDSPAFKAGIIAKDHLVAVDGQKIDSLKQAAKMIKSKARFTATVQRPPSRITKGTDKENTDNEVVKNTLVNFKNVTLSNESDSEDEFVNIVVPLLEPHADNETDKSVVREILSKSTEFKQKADKRLKGKQVKRINPGPMAVENSALTKMGVDQQSSCRDQKSSGKDMNLELAPRTNTDQPTLEQHGNIPQPQGTNQRRVSASSFAALDGLDNKKTKEVPARSDPDWNETVQFDVIKRDQYLNVCVWSKLQEKNAKNILVGYVTIPLMEIALQCLLVGSNTYEECFVLVSPHSGRVISSYPYLRNHPGLKERLCCGDITLSFHHVPSLVDCDESILEKIVSSDNLTSQDDSKDPLESLEPPKHHFILTQFYFPTRCRYCGKKVWTKVAFQCRICGMICHKKCLRSCIGYTHCIHTKPSSSTWFAKKPSKPSVDDTLDDEDGKGVESGQTQIDRTSEFIERAVSGSGSLEHDQTRDEKVNLTVEAVDGTTGKNTETTYKEQTFKGATDANEVESDETERQGIFSDIEIASEKIREAGRELFINLPLEIRKSKLHDMMNKLQVEIDEENETRTDLYQERAKAKDRKQWSFIDSLLAKSEERSQALAMLMLQYCAGLQSCAETEELETCQL